MPVNPRIHIHQLTYHTSERLLFKNLNLTFNGNRIGIVGRNGVGKSTLLHLINGDLLPTSGSIKIQGSISFLSQNLTDYNDKFNHLSGGQITQLRLAKVFSSGANILLLDEPSNNLDKKARNQLYTQLLSWGGLVIVASHDRELLSKMDKIIEINSLGLQLYGGNYETYLEQKGLEKCAHFRHLKDAKQRLRKVRRGVQLTREKREQRQSHGNRLRKSRSQSKLILNKAKECSESFQKQLSKREKNLLDRANNDLTSARSKIEIIDAMHISLPKTFVPAGKVIIEIKSLTFHYDEIDLPLIKNFNLLLQGPQRIALRGSNGSGKTTLLKLILGELCPTNGSIRLGVDRVQYLDQQVKLLSHSYNVIDNFLLLNPTMKEQDARYALAQFLFKSEDAFKMIHELSGGEKVRAALACALMSENPPQLLILDEPTNHLDLSSIACIENALNKFEGAIVVVSHDLMFIEHLKIFDFIDL